MTAAQWAERFRYLSAETSPLPGRFSFAITPYLRGILEAAHERRVRKIACQKSAQIGWTDGVINNYVGYVVHLSPAPTGIMFPRDQNAKDYNVEKFTPMVEATPALAELINTKTRTLDNTQNRKKFLGGFLKFIGSNSTGGVKSTPLKRMIVEEPDDCNLNIKGQGDSIKLAEERVKAFDDSLILIGGTPSIKGVSSIEAEMELSDKRRFLVPCHHCGEAHALEWAHVDWPDEPVRAHPVFGTADTEKAFYACPHCGGLWNDAEKNRNIRRAEATGFGWTATAEFRGVAGFYLNELYSPFAESRLARLVEKYLAAQHEADLGELGALIAFFNSTCGQAYQYQSDLPDEQALKDRAEAYDELTVPWGGLVLTAGVDVQHDRLAVIIRAWGRAEESWLVYWGEIPGQTVVPLAGAWLDLEALLFREIPHAGGAKLRIRATSVDSGDGTATQDAVYAFCRRHRARGVMATKGASDRGEDRREIFSPPKPAVDLDKKQKAWKYGLRPFIVGASRAKDLLLEGRLKLGGAGPGRLHWYQAVRPDYWEQLTSEIKAPHRTVRGKKVWQKKAGVRNEALDGEVLAFHAARSLKLNLLREAHWVMLEQRVRQHELIAQAPDPVPVAPAGEEATAPNEPPAADVPSPPNAAVQPSSVEPKKQLMRRPREPRPGFSVTNW